MKAAKLCQCTLRLQVTSYHFIIKTAFVTMFVKFSIGVHLSFAVSLKLPQ